MPVDPVRNCACPSRRRRARPGGRMPPVRPAVGVRRGSHGV